MTKLYPTCMGKLLLALILPTVFTLSSHAQKMVTYDTTFGGWNAIVTEDVALQGNDSAAGIIFFPGIGQMDANIADLTVNGPHYLITNGLWDGSVSLGNGVHHPFIISLQPPASGYPGSSVLPKVQAILARYRIKRNSLYMTALSQGAWQANEFVTYEATPGDNTCGMMVKAIVNLEGVEPADSTAPYLAESYPRKMGHWAKTCGGRELWVEGSQDWRDLLAGAQNMCDSVPNSATYFMVTYGGGAHCCWNTEYEPGTTWTMPTNSNISEIVGQPQAMNVWQWLLRQGDTTMPASESGATPPVVSAGAAPTVSAGKGQVITLPTSAATLTGTATGNDGATIAVLDWKQGSGPATATIGSPASLSTQVTGMTVAGSYVFTLYATDNNGRSANASITVTVDPAVGTSVTPTPPTVSAGSNQTITLPTSSVTLSGTATANGGDVLSSFNWMLMSGPGFVKFGNEWAVSTAVTGLVAGKYVFQLQATDNKGLTTTSSPVTIVVNATGTTAMAAAVMTGQAVVLTDSAGMADSAMGGQAVGLQLYPNPVQDLLNIRLNGGVRGKVAVSIYDLTGHCVRRVELEKDSWGLEASIDVSGLPKGLYVVQVFTGASTRSAGKFIKL